MPAYIDGKESQNLLMIVHVCQLKESCYRFVHPLVEDPKRVSLLGTALVMEWQPD